MTCHKKDNPYKFNDDDGCPATCRVIEDCSDGSSFYNVWYCTLPSNHKGKHHAHSEPDPKKRKKNDCIAVW